MPITGGSIGIFTVTLTAMSIPALRHTKHWARTSKRSWAQNLEVNTPPYYCIWATVELLPLRSSRGKTWAYFGVKVLRELVICCALELCIPDCRKDPLGVSCASEAASFETLN